MDEQEPGGSIPPARLDFIEIARRLCGAGTADKLIQDFGGTRIFLPRRPAPDHPVSVSIGHKAALAIGAECHGISLDVPLGFDALRTRRKALIAKLRAEGKPVRAIARAAGTGERNVYYHLAKLRRAPRGKGD